jgi:hypothetical protein
MRAVDILSLSVAALVGLFTLTLQPWSTGWWASVAVAAVFAISAAMHILWNTLPQAAKAHLTAARWAPDGTVRNGKIRTLMGVVVLVALVGSVYLLVPKPPNTSQIASKLLGRSVGLVPTTPSSQINTYDSPNAILQSTEAKMLLRCDVPPGDPKQFASQFPIYKNESEGLGDALGINVSVEIIRDGVRTTFEATSAEGKERLWRTTGANITKFVIERRRVGQSEIVSFTADRPGVQMEMLYAMRPIGTKADYEKFERSMEKMIGYPTGSCHIF